MQSQTYFVQDDVVTGDDLDYQVEGSNSRFVKCNTFHRKNFTFTLYGGYEGVPENLLINVCGWLLLLILFTILRKRAWNYGRIALVQKSEQRDEHILKKNGHDAVQYLSFQRHIILYMFIICVVSLVIVLPVNFQGNLEGDSKTFGHTTLSNLNPHSPLLWVHVGLAFVFLPLGIFFMRQFSLNLSIVEDESLIGRSLMITAIPKEHCSRNILLQHFQEAYSEFIIQDIHIAYDVRKLIKLDRQRETAMQAKLWCETVYKETGLRPRMRPYTCGRICVCGDACGCPQIDGLEYYTEEEHALISAVDREKSIVLQKPLGIAFVTFQTDTMAEIVYKDHQEQCKCSTNPPTSSLNCILEPHNWQVEFAPPPEDIFWKNLAVSDLKWYIRAVAINLFLFLVLFFLTTPAIFVNSLDLIQLRQKIQRLSPVLSEFLPTLLLWLVSVLLPIIVAYSDDFLFHWTRSTRNHSIMKKTFVFLLFMVVILPSLGLTSAKAFLEWAVRPQNETYRWECIFLPDNGAFFVNYVITSGFVGTALEIIRFPELFMYAIHLCFSRSVAEQVGIRKAILWEFEFGVQYAWILLIFATVIIYSLPCPLIVPFGLVYMCFKHCVDRYNIYFAYGSSKINQSIHASAINYVVFCLILQQVSLFFFSFLRTGWSNITIVSLSVFVLTLMVFFGQVFFHWFKELSPITYKKLIRRPISHTMITNHSPTEEPQTYVPTVLKMQSSRADVYSTNNGRTYGTSENSVSVTPDVEQVGLGQELAQLVYIEQPYQRY
ncbi:calcium permeable stress-gated cation channel 1-like [Limulus polyphemus]|uniref:Calcium permeable stress-gated cation channel 1-like n=1 Tax=Limulus polyphemus TaxID=6850 RepID=A0ABM1S279_LIMPO|nr:calcium permeable stress-gated cation channel 1-like [Limulus polyphemus]